MDVHEKLAAAAACIAVPARAAMLLRLMDGRAYTAGELAMSADVSAQTASNHLAQLLRRNLLRVYKQGRHRYFSFADERGARAVETLLALQLPGNEPGSRNGAGPRGDTVVDWRTARTCYDHLAGRIAVSLARALERRQLLCPAGESYELSSSGRAWFLRELGIATDALALQRRALARQCIDWTERRPHIGGALGAALLNVLLERGWVKRTRKARILQVTPLGARELARRFGADLRGPQLPD
jgi:DNA-binding transcriptional ArsR family regulator